MTADLTPVADVDPVEARRLVATGGLLLDVREDEEWMAGRAPDAVHVPMGSVGESLGDIPDSGTVVCVCRLGGRSLAVAQALSAEGHDVRNLDGGMVAWEQAGLSVVTDSGEPGRII